MGQGYAMEGAKRMKKVFVPFVLLLVVIILVGISILSRGGDGGYSASGKGLSTAAQATATFGAEQFHIQLTAIAEQERNCPSGSPCSLQP